MDGWQSSFERNNISDQTSRFWFRRCFDRSDNRLLNIVLRLQYGFDLAGFHSVASDFELKVFSSQVIKQSVGPHPTQVTRVVYLFVAAAWINGKTLLGEIWPPPIPRRNVAALDHYFPNGVERRIIAFL